MAHGWNSCLHDYPPLPSDPGTQRISEFDGTFPQHPENICEQHVFPGTTSSQGVLSTSSFNTNSSKQTKMDWQTDGENKFSEKRGNGAISCSSSETIPAPEILPPPLECDLQGLNQDCDVPPTSCLGSYPDVSSCSVIDASEATPSCEFMENKVFLTHKTECFSTNKSLAGFFSQSGNIPFLTDSLCGDMPERNANLPSTVEDDKSAPSRAQENIEISKKANQQVPDHPSATSSMPNNIVNAAISDGNNDDYLLEDGIKCLPAEKEQISPGMSTFDYDQEDNPDSIYTPDKCPSKDVERTVDILKKKKDQLDSENPNENESPMPNFTNSLIDNIKPNCEEKQIQTNDSSSSKDASKEIEETQSPMESDLQPDSQTTRTNSPMQEQLVGEAKISTLSQPVDYSSPGISFDRLEKIPLNEMDSDVDVHINSCKQSNGTSSKVHACTEVKVNPFEEVLNFSKEIVWSPDQNCNSLGDMNNEKVENPPMPFSEPQSSGTEKDSTQDENYTGIHSNHSDHLAKGELIHSNVSYEEKQSEANTKAIPEKDSTLYESLKEQKAPSSFGDDFEHARESSDELDTYTQILSPADLLYGEPLSREDSRDSYEMNRDSQEYEPLLTKFEKDSIDYPDEAQVNLKFSFQKKDLLHPVVIMDNLESSNEMGSSYHCNTCQFTNQNVDHLIEHHFSCQPMMDFQFCPRCNVYLLNNEEGKKHFCGATKEDARPNINPVQKRKIRGPHKCKKCGLVFSKILLFVKHMRTHTGQTPYRCHTCGVYFAQSSSLRRHQKIVLKCKTSQLSTSNSDAIVVKHEPSPQQDASLKGVTQSFLDQSIRECFVKVVDISKTNLCHKCGKTFDSPKKVKKHIYNVHSKNTGFLKLSKPSTSERKRQIAKVIEVQKKYKCPLCPQLFKYSSNRARHLRHCVHKATYEGKRTVDGRYACPLCPSTFTSVSNRSRHIKVNCMKECINRLSRERSKSREENNFPKTEENEQEPDQNDSVQDPQSQVDMLKLQRTDDKSKKQACPPLVASKHVLRFKCDYCPAAFSHSSGKYRHMKKHEIFELTGKTFKYRRSVFSSISKPLQEHSGSTKSDECTKKSEETVQPDLSCHFCGRVFQVLAELKKHEHGHRGERPYRCLECAKGFKKRSHLLAHKLIHQKRIQCTVCRKILPSVEKLHEHQQLHKKVLKCPACPAQFKYPVFLRRHLRKHPNIKKAHQTEEMPTKQEEFLHLGTDQSESNVQCSLCQKVFDNPQMLRRHCFTHISGSFPNQCPFCGLKFKKRRYLLRHIVQHTRDKIFCCTNCGRQFNQFMPFRIHSQNCVPPQNLVLEKPKIKDMNPHHCSICPRKFGKKVRLVNHLIAHKKNTLHLCSKCGKHYGINAIGRHQADCENDAKLPPVENLTSFDSKETSLQACQNEKKPLSKPKSTAVINFICAYCPRKFRFKSLYFRHLISHTGVQPYACVHCGQRFATQSTCAEHEAFCEGVDKNQSIVKSEAAMKMDSLREEAKKILSGEVEYKCRFCTRTFTKARNLRYHILTHNEVKPYRCKACDSCFSRYDHLKIHQSRCKIKKTRLEVRIPKLSLDDIGMGWQNKLDVNLTKKEDLFYCEKCLRSFPTQSKLSRHITMFHTVKQFKCTNCGAAFSHEKTLKKHKKMKKCRKQPEEKNDSLSFNADQPAKNVTTSLEAKSGHVKIQAFRNKNYVCNFCPRSFKTSQQRGLHTRRHTRLQQYSCGDCGQKFTNKDLLMHHSSICSKVLCDRCGGFFFESQREHHKETCTPRQTTSTNSQNQKTIASTKGFSCAYCNSKFVLFSQLQEHFLSMHKLENTNQSMSAAPLQQLLSDIEKIKEEHLDEHYEERCDYNVNQRPSRNVMKLSLKPLICQVCNMSFINKAGLMGHQRVHTTVYPYKCKVCCKGFWSETAHRKHYKKCKSSITQQTEGPLKAKIDFAFDYFKHENTEQNTSSAAILHTTPSSLYNIKEEEEETSVHSYKGDQIGSNKEKKTVQYQCSECDKSFTDGLLLISHLEDHGREEQEKKRNSCSKCGKVCSSQAHLEKHMRFHRTTLKYSCNQCYRVFPSNSDLEKHKASHELDKPYSCKICQQRFLTRPALAEHYTTLHEDLAFHCPFCTKVYASKRSLYRHCKESHPKEWRDSHHTMPEKSNNVQQSGSNLSTTGESDENENSDSDSDSAPYFPCHVCGKTFATSENLEDHQLCHLGEKPHECGECGKCFFLASQLQQHQRMHKSEFQCQTCGRGFVTLFALRNHKHSHGKNRPHRCSKCQLSFTGPTQLAEHMSTHREENFPCDICNEVFQSKSSRAEHRKTHAKAADHPLSSAPTEEPESFPFAGQLKYRCGVCAERFRNPEELSEHGCLAATERLYSCINCNKHFLHASHLKKHMHTHQSSWSITEYPCNQCNNWFYSSHKFLQHLKSHVIASDDGQKEPSDGFICPLCHQCFSSATELIVHFPTHPDGTLKPEETNDKVNEPGPHKRRRLTSGEFESTDSGGNSLHADATQHHEHFKEQQTPAESENLDLANKQTHGVKTEEADVDVLGQDFLTCTDCEKHFCSKSAYLEHQIKKHPNKSRFKCDRCGKSFAKMRYLKKHESRHRLKDTDIAVNSDEAKFICNQCSSKFSTPLELSSHMRLHAEKQAGEFRCDMCYKSFSQRALLKHHQESHIGQVVYECTECDKAFAFPYLLEEHRQTHAGSV